MRRLLSDSFAQSQRKAECSNATERRSGWEPGRSDEARDEVVVNADVVMGRKLRGGRINAMLDGIGGFAGSPGGREGVCWF